MATNDRFGTSASGPKSSVGESISSSASAAMSSAGEHISDVAGQAQGVAQEQLDKLSASIRKNPIQSAGIAAGIGFMLALLARK